MLISVRLWREKLEELHGLFLGKETVRRIMVRAGLWVPRKQRAARIPQPRYRRPCTGELIQIDGCDHDWFEGRGPAPRWSMLMMQPAN
jgi:hypothetical protein